MKNIYKLSQIDKNKTLYVHHHLGLGDHIVCYGILNYILKNNYAEKIKIFCWKRNFSSLFELYKNLNLDFLMLEDYINDKYQINNILESDEQLLSIGHEKFQEFNFGKYQEQSFYNQLEIPFYNRYSLFDYKRDMKKEELLIDFLNLKKQEYILIHDYKIFDFNKDFIEKKLNKKFDLPIINLSYIYDNYTNSNCEFNFFNIGMLIENCKEFYCLESCTKAYIEYLDTNNVELFFYSGRGCDFTSELKKYIYF
jgi:hypothetical protein